MIWKHKKFDSNYLKDILTNFKKYNNSKIIVFNKLPCSYQIIVFNTLQLSFLFFKNLLY